MNDFAAVNEIYGDVLLVPGAGARNRPGRAAAQGRPRRDRPDRLLSLVVAPFDVQHTLDDRAAP